MKFTKVEKISGRRTRNNLKVFLNEFMCSNVAIAKVELHEGEYSSFRVARRSLDTSAKRYCLPVKASYRKDGVYIYRTDMK